MKKTILIFLLGLVLIILFSQNILACTTPYTGTCTDIKKFIVLGGGSTPCGTWTTGSGSCTWTCIGLTGQTCPNCYCVCSLTNECSSGAKECLSSTTYRTCGSYDGDCALEWSSSQTCASGTTCSAGTCASCVACILGTTQCSGTQIQTCDGYGNGCTQWSIATNCPSGQTCVGGTCTNIEHKINITVSTKYCVEHSVNRCAVGEKISLVINSSNYCTFWGATGWNLRYRNVSGSDYTYLTLGSFNCVDGNSVVNFTVPTYPSSTYINYTSPIFGKSHAIISFNRETPSGGASDYSSDVNITSPLITVSSISSNCQINSAQMINSSCDMDGCLTGDKINLSVTVVDASKCLFINKIEFDVS